MSESMMIHPETIVEAAQVTLMRRMQVIQTENASGRRQFHTNATYAGDDVAGVATKVLESFARTEEFGNLMSEPGGPNRVAVAVVETTQCLMSELERRGHMVHIGPLYHFGVQPGSENVS